jgi:hypothetical protein
MKLSIEQIMMIFHGLQVLDFALLKVRIPFIPTPHGHHHLIVRTHHVILSVVVRVMLLLLLLLRVSGFMLHFLLSHVLLLLVEGLRDDALGIEVHGEVLQTLNFKFENLGAVEIFIVYRQFLLDF